jgi:adenosylhomocysteine nucleosidase
MPERVAIIAAMEREVQPLVRNWQRIQLPGSRGWRSENLLLLCGGMGANAARKSAETAVREFQPHALVSAGFAGALDQERKVGEIFLPARVIDGTSGNEYQCSRPQSGSTLLTFHAMADADCKQQLARRYQAQAVDMEAAAVAEVALSHGLEFRVVKAISEELEFPLPAFGTFVTAEGELRVASLIAHLAARPRLWPPVWALRKNAARAATALSFALRSLERDWSPFADIAQLPNSAG